jgi:hypothetical protein
MRFRLFSRQPKQEPSPLKQAVENAVKENRQRKQQAQEEKEAEWARRAVPYLAKLPQLIRDSDTNRCRLDGFDRDDFYELSSKNSVDIRLNSFTQFLVSKIERLGLQVHPKRQSYGVYYLEICF